MRSREIEIRRLDLGFILLLLAAFLAFLQTASCSSEPAHINKMDAGEKADLVYFFQKGTTPEEIFEFQRTVAGIPNERGSGYSSLPGEMTNVAIRVGGFDGQSLRLKPNATEEQKSFIRNRLQQSKLVYRVYENVVPNQITDLQ